MMVDCQTAIASKLAPTMGICGDLYSAFILCQSSPIAFLELSRCCL
ncbi:hypothetical protein PHLH4_20340 [Pseudomonas sp. St316]|nr:hypothetical protein PHLH4_20340 [Pseudomonas sp. St316]